jgi:hypothetical protein
MGRENVDTPAVRCSVWLGGTGGLKEGTATKGDGKSVGVEVEPHVLAVCTDDGVDEERVGILWIVGSDLQALKPLETKDAESGGILHLIEKVELDGVDGQVQDDTRDVWAEASQQSGSGIGEMILSVHCGCE